MNPFSGKTAIITGGASGIGRAVAERLVRQGATVVLADINGEQAKTVAREMTGKGSASGAALDVADAAAVQALVDRVAAEHGRLDYIFNNAGIALAGEARDMELADWNRILNVNLHGVVHGVQAAYPLMVRQGFGHIVNTASIAGLVPFPLSVAYSTTKHAVVGLSTSLRAEGAGLGVKVSAVCPGFIETPLVDSIKILKMDKKAATGQLPFKLHPVGKAAEEILKGVARNEAIIVITPQAKLMWYFHRLSPELFDLANGLIAKQGRKLRK